MIELGLFLCAFATLFGFVRIFGDHGQLGGLVVVAAIASLLAAALRRRGVGIILSTVVHTVVGIVVISNVYMPDEVTNLLPTPHGLGVAYSSIVDELAVLRVAVPPVEPTTGILLIIAVLVWLLAFFADTAALRVHATAQAVLPFVIVFVAVGVSEPGFSRVQAVIVFAAAVGIYALVVQHARARDLRWSGTGADARHGIGRLLVTGSVMAVFVLVAVALAATITPVREPVLTLRQGDGSGREVVSPFVSIRSLLGPRSETEMFRVTADVPSYWRLTALDTYDASKDIWVSSGEYRRARSTLATTTDPAVPTVDSAQHFEILGIGGPWVPMAFEATRYDGRLGVTFNTETSTLFADEDLVDGQVYDIASAVPAFSAEALASSPRPAFDEIDERLLRVPIESPAERLLIDGTTAGHDDLYESLIALQNHLRTEFTYAEDVDYSTSEDPVAAFLTERAGFCQQFSSVFAITARRLGLPSRVAVGFTMGEEVDETVDGEDGSQDGRATSDDSGDGTARTYLVRGMHAHAWPEVYFHDLGWVAFEPTPGRGNPATAEYTGVAAAQAEMEPDDASDPVTTDPAASQTSSVTETTDPSLVSTDAAGGSTDDSDDGDATGESDEDHSDRTLLRLLIASVMVLGAVAVVVIRRLRRRGGDGAVVEDADPASEALADAWESVLAALAELGLSPLEVETPSEFVERVSARLADRDDGPPESHAVLVSELSNLATIETLRRYSSVFDTRGGDDAEMVDRLISDADRSAAVVLSSLDSARDVETVS